MKYLQGLVIFALTTIPFSEGNAAEKNTINQVIRFEWNEIEAFNAYTIVDNMNSTNTPCGKNCVSIALNVTPPFSTGGIKFIVTQARSNADTPVSDCKAALEIPFEINSGYLVTRMKSYTFSMTSNIQQSCPKTSFMLDVRGDPTEPTGYTIKLFFAKSASKSPEH